MSDKKLADELIDAYDDNLVDYLMVHQKFDLNGNLKPTEISKFKL